MRRADIVVTDLPSVSGSVSTPAFGFDGERSELTCYDLIAERYSGTMVIVGDANSLPQ